MAPISSTKPMSQLAQTLWNMNLQTIGAVANNAVAVVAGQIAAPAAKTLKLKQERTKSAVVADMLTRRIHVIANEPAYWDKTALGSLQLYMRGAQLHEMEIDFRSLRTKEEIAAARRAISQAIKPQYEIKVNGTPGDVVNYGVSCSGVSVSKTPFYKQLLVPQTYGDDFTKLASDVFLNPPSDMSWPNYDATVDYLCRDIKEKRAAEFENILDLTSEAALLKK